MFSWWLPSIMLLITDEIEKFRIVNSYKANDFRSLGSALSVLGQRIKWIEIINRKSKKLGIYDLLPSSTHKNFKLNEDSLFDSERAPLISRVDS